MSRVGRSRDLPIIAIALPSQIVMMCREHNGFPLDAHLSTRFLCALWMTCLDASSVPVGVREESRYPKARHEQSPFTLVKLFSWTRQPRLGACYYRILTLLVR